MKINPKHKKYIPYIVTLISILMLFLYINRLNNKNEYLIKQQMKVEKINKTFRSDILVYKAKDEKRKLLIEGLKKEHSVLINKLDRPPVIKVIYKERVREVIIKKDCDEELDKRDVIIQKQQATIKKLTLSNFECNEILKKCDEVRIQAVEQTRRLSKSKVNRVLVFAVGAVVGAYGAYKLMRR